MNLRTTLRFLTFRVLRFVFSKAGLDFRYGGVHFYAFRFLVGNVSKFWVLALHGVARYLSFHRGGVSAVGEFFSSSRLGSY